MPWCWFNTAGGGELHVRRALNDASGYARIMRSQGPGNGHRCCMAPGHNGGGHVAQWVVSSVVLIMVGSAVCVAFPQLILWLPSMMIK